MFVDLDWPLNASSLLSASAELLVHILVCLSVLLNHATSFYVNKNISNTATGLTQMWAANHSVATVTGHCGQHALGIIPKSYTLSVLRCHKTCQYTKSVHNFQFIPLTHTYTYTYTYLIRAFVIGGLQARVRDLFSPSTAFGLQYRRCGSCHTPVFTWRPRIPGLRSSSVERATGQCHLRTIFVLIPATPEDISFPATTASITLITVSWSWSAYIALSTTLILANWTELNWVRSLVHTEQERRRNQQTEELVIRIGT